MVTVFIVMFISFQINKFPEIIEQRARSNRTLIFLFLIPDEKWVFDRQVQNGCSKKRPDVLLDVSTHHIIVEIDENRHINYDTTCENKENKWNYTKIGGK